MVSNMVSDLKRTTNFFFMVSNMIKITKSDDNLIVFYDLKTIKVSTTLLFGLETIMSGNKLLMVPELQRTTIILFVFIVLNVVRKLQKITITLLIFMISNMVSRLH